MSGLERGRTKKRTRFTEERIIDVLKEAEAGAKTGDLVLRHGISAVTIYNWKPNYGGLEVENAKAKRLLADTILDNVALTRRAAVANDLL